jgi:hypothetical protein
LRIIVEGGDPFRMIELDEAVEGIAQDDEAFAGIAAGRLGGVVRRLNEEGSMSDGMAGSGYNGHARRKRLALLDKLYNRIKEQKRFLNPKGTGSRTFKALPLGAPHEMTSIWKRIRIRLIDNTPRPANMVNVEVSVENDVDVIGCQADPLQVVQKLSTTEKDLALINSAWTIAGIDENDLRVDLDEMSADAAYDAPIGQKQIGVRLPVGISCFGK